MKGIIIYGNPMWGDNERATYCELINEASFELTQHAPKEVISCLKGEALESSKAVCSEDDTYDFETGALIALMKMCGLEKSAKAYAEIFGDTAYGDALNERDNLKEQVKDLLAYNNGLIRKIEQKHRENGELKEENKHLKEKSAELLGQNGCLKYIKSCNESNIKSYEDVRARLEKTNESLKKDNESFRKTCEKLKEENFNLKTQISVMAEKETELIDSNKRLSNKSERLNDALNTWKQRFRDLNDKNGELVVENYNLKTDCEKLQHGYVDTDMMFCGGRAYGKQYKALVNLFKKLPQDKIEAAYKEVYNTELPAWNKEFLNQMYGIYKESREKAELPRTLDINGIAYRKGVSLKDLHRALMPTEYTWELKMPTKREKMWQDIKNFNGASCIEVNKADVIDFLEELEKEIPLVHWPTGDKPTSFQPMFNFKMWYECDKVYFFIDDDYVTYGFDKESSRTNVRYMTYLPPMRWDLFKKGRKIIRVTPDNFGEAMACIRANVALVHGCYGWERVIKNHFSKQHGFIRVRNIAEDTGYASLEFMEPEDLVSKHLAKPTVYSSNKIVDWEDVK